MKKVKIDSLGRVVVPINYRKALNISTETNLIMECNGNKICITPETFLCRICEKEISGDREIPLCSECIEKIKKYDIT